MVQCSLAKQASSATSAPQVERAVRVGSIAAVGVGRGVHSGGVASRVGGGVEAAGVGVGRGSHHGGGTVGGQELRLGTGHGHQSEQAKSELVEGKEEKRRSPLISQNT